MKVIIFEGASTSGKTTLANLLTDKLKKSGQKVLLVEEIQTLIPVLEILDVNKHLDHLAKVVKSISQKDFDFVVIDRFHLTSAALCDAPISKYEKIEEELLKYNPTIVFLKVEKSELGNRIFKALKHRGPYWKEHVASKGSDKQIVAWFLETQKKLLNDLKKSKIKHEIIDTTSSKYEKITEKLLTIFVRIELK